MNAEEYKSDLKSLSTEEIYNKYVIGGDIWFFKHKFGDSWYDKYNSFKIFISQKLGVHYNDIAIAGSAKLGFSINPKKNFKCFDKASDIDIIIISQEYFYLFWDSYRRDSYNLIKTKIGFHLVCFSIFRKYLTLEGFDTSNPDYAKWLKKTQGFEKELQLDFEIENDINYRIFESWNAAKEYYMHSIERTKEAQYENF